MNDFSPDTLHLIGHKLCPYVQRVVIALEELNVPYKRTDIELENKPDWLEQLSPINKVPLLLINKDQYLFESDVICEYLNEISSISLHPKDPIQKAQHRAWIAFGSGILQLFANLIYNDKSEASYQKTLQDIKQKLSFLENQITGSAYFTSTCFHLIDASYGPIFRYVDYFKNHLNYDLLSNLKRTRNWAAHLRNRPSVIRAVPKGYNDQLYKFIAQNNSYLAQISLNKPAL
ncbi:glutathione S-transferase family protein [Kiloniella majae]|uniref:glutathione S-transferase family protein n=1 Tax=Kiloniella majae TaxID=1938558 RepID=UPI000A277981|nr:glutathione S-transferase family protein [Kiloniella majae]